MDFLMAIIVTVSLISVESARYTNVRRRFNVLESRVTTLESRSLLESAYTQEIADKVSVMNITLEELESVCHASNHPIKETINIDMIRSASFMKTEARVLTAFKEEKDELRNTVNKIENTLSEIQKNMSREVELQAVIDDYTELKNTVENINMSLLEKQEELSIKIEILSSEFKQDTKEKHEELSSKIDILVTELNKYKLNEQKTGLMAEELKHANEQLKGLKTAINYTIGRTIACSNLWARYEMFCYRYFKVLMNYTEAKQKCASSGAVVVDLHSQSEVDFVQGLTGNERFWIGLTDVEEEGTWTWERTRSKASFLNWRPGQPDSAGYGQDCVVAGWQSPYDKWNDRECENPHNYVCKNSL